MAYEKNKQTPSRTLRYYHVQDYLLRPSCSMRRRARRRPFLLVTLQGTFKGTLEMTFQGTFEGAFKGTCHIQRFNLHI